VEARRQTESVRTGSWQRATRSDRALSGEKKPGEAGSVKPNGPIEILRSNLSSEGTGNIAQEV
jgi:hypothetical protein